MGDPLQGSRYQIIRRLAVGGMGEVLLARTEGDERVGLGSGLVVIKRTLPNHPKLEHQNQMLREEGRVALRLRHANLVETFALDQVESTPLLVMEFLAGRSMAQVLGAAKRTAAMVPPPVAIKVIHEAACGLHFAHTLRDGGKLAGMVHRDVSPANIIVTFDGRVKVIDFGVAKADDSEIKTSTGVLKGKIGYMSPEHTLGEKLDGRSDLWSLGVLLWETLVADRLFASQNPALTLHKINHGEIVRPSTRRPDVPPSVDDLVMRLLSRSREDRVASGAELVQRIEAITDVEWRTADLGRFLSERFPEEAERGRQEGRDAARAGGEPVPQGLTIGSTLADADLDVATVVADRRDLIELARRAAEDPEGGDDVRTLQLSAAEVAAITGDGPDAPPPGGPLEDRGVTAPLHSAPGASDDDLQTPRSPSQPRGPLTEEDPALDGTLTEDDDSLLPTLPQGRPAAARTSGRARPAPTPTAADRESGSGPAPERSPGHLASGRARRAGPSAASVALGTFGVLACLMGAVFGMIQKAPPPLFIAWPGPDGAEVISARIDVPQAPPPAYRRPLNLSAPKLVFDKARGSEPVDAERLLAALQQDGIAERATLPHSLRSAFASALAPLFLLLGALALAWALPAFLLRGAATWAARALLLAGAVSFGAWGLSAGLGGWPGLGALQAPEVHLPAAQLQAAQKATGADSTP